MKVLVVSNMYPSKSNPYAGVFIKTQFEYMNAHHSDSTDFDLFYMTYANSSFLVTLLKYFSAYIRFIPKLFRSYDIIHVHYFGFLAPIALIYKFFHPYAKTFITFHGSDINKDMPEKGIKTALFKFLSRKFNGIIAVGKGLEIPLKKKLDITPHQILCAGVNDDVFFKVHDSPKLYDFIVVGSFVQVKGLDIFRQAVKELNRPLTRICFVGHGPEEDIVNEISQYAIVDIIHHVDQRELRTFYNQSKFLFFPSKNDAFGLVVTESIYCGTPAIVNSKGGAQDQVIHGMNGFIYEQHDPREMAELMKSVLDISDEKYKNLSSRCTSSNYQYSLSKVTSDMMKAYKDACWNYRTIFKISLA